MIGPRRRVIGVLAAVDDARERHPDLQLPLTWRRLQRVFDRDGIILKRMPIDGNADVIGFDGTFVVTINSSAPARRHTRYAAHEYGHIRLHFDRSGEIEKNLSPCRRGDPRELEAELFAAMLLAGPDATPSTPRIAALIAALEVADRKQKLPSQLPLHLPDAPVAAPTDEPEITALQFMIRRGKRNPPRIPASTVGLGVSHDSLRRQATEDGRGLKFFTDIGWCAVYDVKFIANREGRSVRKLVKPGDRWAQVRYFILGTDDRRCYVFKSDRESRRPDVALLDRQFASSVAVDKSGMPTTNERSHTKDRKL